MIIQSAFNNYIQPFIPPKLAKPVFERNEGLFYQPKDEVKKSFFGKVLDPNSQREDWYKVSEYVAEFWCTASNIGFFIVGIRYRSVELIVAGLASAVSHAIPKQWLNIVDKMGVALVAIKVLANYTVILKHPWLLAPLAVAGAVNWMDAYRARKHGENLPHVVWHLTAAAVAELFLRYI